MVFLIFKIYNESSTELYFALYSFQFINKNSKLRAGCMCDEKGLAQCVGEKGDFLDPNETLHGLLNGWEVRHFVSSLC